MCRGSSRRALSRPRSSKETHGKREKSAVWSFAASCYHRYLIGCCVCASSDLSQSSLVFTESKFFWPARLARAIFFLFEFLLLFSLSISLLILARFPSRIEKKKLLRHRLTPNNGAWKFFNLRGVHTLQFPFSLHNTTAANMLKTVDTEKHRIIVSQSCNTQIRKKS